MIKVLIVDDEYIMRQGLRYMINWEQEGYEIVGEATNGKDALALTEKLEPHIIISDIVMPMLDGVDFSDVVHRIYPHIQMIILSGYDNFEYVKQTFLNGVVDYILKPTLNPEELKNVLQKASSRILGYKPESAGKFSYERMMERYLLGYDKALDPEQFGYIFHASGYRIYAVNIKIKNRANQDLSVIFYEKIKRAVQSMEDIQRLMLLIREELSCVIFGYEMHQKKYLLEKIQNLNDQLVLLHENTFGIVSRPFQRIEEVRQVYQQDIIEYVNRAFYYQGQTLLIQEQQRRENPSAQIEKFDLFEYTRLLSGRKHAGALKQLLQYCRNALDAKMEADRIKNQVKNLIYHYLDFCQIAVEERENQRYRIFRDIDDAVYEKEFRRVMEKAVSELNALGGQNPTMNDERIEKMLAYISGNFQEELTLEKLAEEFNFNYNYLSSFFNQQMKEGFSEYLNRVRIDKACQLLREKKGSIAAISSEVGYSDHSYFCRVFKKIMGVPPSVWRREQFYEQIHQDRT